jgi:hypothetical protein
MDGNLSDSDDETQDYFGTAATEAVCLFSKLHCACPSIATAIKIGVVFEYSTCWKWKEQFIKATFY